MASKDPVDPRTVFEAQSMSKPVFAYAVMQLSERNVIDLDTPLTQYTSHRLIEGEPRLDLITARHVLSHSTGFQNWRSQRQPLAIQFTPGTQYLYSCEGYSYQQSIVTELRGHRDPRRCSTFEADVEFCATDFDAYMTANVLRPFGMAASGYVWDGRFKNCAIPHDMEGRPLEKAHPTSVAVARYGAAGGLHTTASDYATFMMHVVGSARRGRFDLMPEHLQEMVRPQVKQNDSSSWALGWAVQHTADGDFLYHAGDGEGFHSMAVASVRQQSGYALLTNGANGARLIEQLLSGETLVQFL
jgi:CubicO group peptidase (beta-lactamase class C family)